jgi:hypothetical protein
VVYAACSVAADVLLPLIADAAVDAIAKSTGSYSTTARLLRLVA